VEGLPVELCAKVLPAADYAVFTLRGAQIEQDEPIIDDWLQAHSYRVAQPVFIQRYDRRYKGLERLEESEIDFLLPVVRADETDARA
jgi:predicted transcriptional regulator YdeE